MRSTRRRWRVEKWSAWRRRVALPSAKPGGGTRYRVRTVCEHDTGEWDDVEADAAALLSGVTDALRGRPVEERGARIYDEDAGLVYEATIAGRDGRVWLTGLTILTLHPDDPARQIDHDVLVKVQAKRIAEQVSLQLAAEDKPAHREPIHTADGREAARIAGDESTERTGRHDRPTDDELIALVKAGKGRKAIAEMYDRGPSTVDNWLGPLRRAGRIPYAKPGRRVSADQERARGASSRQGATPNRPARKGNGK